ncbi:MAG: rRNA maturation RNase YbeY [Chloroflexi bacterium]|nr:rRNA maturation RNase YbeY [Chloroflexota bacterium]MCY4111284.1 rRNA maturation RNase YbeY [Chloroflexota bacterium]
MTRATLTLDLVDDQDVPEPLRELATRVTRSVADATGLQGAVALRICSDADMQRLNRQFRHVDQPTDVLAFPPGASGPGSAPESVGDVALSYARVVSQGQAHGHGLEREFAYLVTHALLHLAGFKHDDARDYQRMRRAEEKILASIGLARDPIPAK